MAQPAHLLIVAPPFEAEVLRHAARQAGYQVTLSAAADAAARQSEIGADAALVSAAAADVAALIQTLRSAPGGDRLPVVAIGAGEAGQVGANAAVPRPVDPKEVLAKLGSLLDRAAPAASESATGAPSAGGGLSGLDDALEGQLRVLWSSLAPDRGTDLGLSDLLLEGTLPPWRAATQVLPPAAVAPGAPTDPGPDPGPASGKEAGPPLPETAEQSAMGEGTTLPRAAPPLDPDEGGTFARRVRHTLSAIEQRLFPDTPPPFPEEAAPPDEDPLPDIDLDALGLEGISAPEFDVSFDEEAATLPVPPAATPAPTPAAAAPAAAPPAEALREAADTTEIIRGSTVRLPEPPAASASATDPAPALPSGTPTPEPLATIPALRPLATVPLATTPSSPGAPAGLAREIGLLPEQGTLSEIDVPTLLHRIHRDGFRGRLRLFRGSVEKSAFFEEGLPVFATSTLPHDRMGDLLFREGKITRVQLEECQRIIGETGRRVGQVLCDLLLLKPQELFPTVRRHVEDILYSLFAWADGSFELLPGQELGPDQRVRLLDHPDALVLEGIRRKFDLERLIERSGGAETVLHPLAADLEAALGDAGLEAGERAMVALVDGRRSIADLVREGPLDETGVLRLGYGLVCLELVRADRHGAAPQARALPERDRAIDRERVRARLALVEEADYFALLGVRRDATDHEIRRAYEAALRELAPDRLAPELGAELAGALAAIAQALAEAYAILENRELRNLYRTHLRDAG